jgi:hypothetical protein
MGFHEGRLSMPNDQHPQRQEPDTLWPMIWVGAALVIIAAVSYWVNSTS